MIIGITGGTGSGKTTALEAIRQLGGVIIDCDAVYHELLKTDTGLLCAIENRFPGTVEDGVLQRKKLGSIVFSNPAALEDLNRITHGAVRKRVLELLQETPELAAIDAIGLFEGGLSSLCHATVAITAPTAQRIQRLMARDGISAQYAAQRIAAQHSPDYFREHCDYVLENTGNRQEFLDKCLAFFRQLIIIKENPEKEN